VFGFELFDQVPELVDVFFFDEVQETLLVELGEFGEEECLLALVGWLD
jgi:hypothetical protein